MAGPDLSLITNAPNLTDRIMQQQAISSQLQAQQIDVRQKQNAYAAQVMSAAAGSGDPIQYAKGKQLLASQGIDVSNWSDDPAIGFEQAKAARTALMTPGALMNAQIQAQRNGIMASGTNGTIAPTQAPSLSGDNPFQQAAPTTGAPSLTAPIPPAASATSAPTGAPAGSAAATIPAFSGTSANNPPSLTSPMGSDAPATAIPPAPASTDAKYAGMNPKTRNEALDMDTKIYNERPDVKGALTQATSAASDAGKINADANNALNVMVSNLPAVISRTNGIIQYAPNASSGMGVHSGGTEDGLYPTIANSSMGQYFEPDTATANSMTTKLAAQGAFPEIAAALKNSSMKGNKFLEQVMSNGLSINMQSPSETKVTQAQQNLTNYVQGIKSTAAQVRAQGGQNVPTDDQIDAMVAKLNSAAPASPAQASPNASLPTFKSESDPGYAQLPSGSKFIDATTGLPMVKH